MCKSTEKFQICGKSNLDWVLRVKSGIALLCFINGLQNRSSFLANQMSHYNQLCLSPSHFSMYDASCMHAVFALSFQWLIAVATFDLIGHWLSSKELPISHRLALCRHIDGILMCFEKIHKSINVDQPKADVFSQGTHYLSFIFDF